MNIGGLVKEWRKSPPHSSSAHEFSVEFLESSQAPRVVIYSNGTPFFTFEQTHPIREGVPLPTQGRLILASVGVDPSFLPIPLETCDIQGLEVWVLQGGKTQGSEGYYRLTNGSENLYWLTESDWGKVRDAADRKL